MQTVENTSDEERQWPGIQTVEGTTLELEPGESAQVEDLPEDFEDPYLKVAASETPAPSAPAKPTPPAAPTKTTTEEPQP